MRVVRLLPRAIQDLRSIWDFVALDSAFYATRYIDRLETACYRLADTPGIGRLREDVDDANIRSVPEGSHVIFFRVGEEQIDVLRIVHGAQDVRRIQLR